MSLAIKGKLIKILNAESGVARSGNQWKKQDFVIESQDQFARTICFTLFNDKVSLMSNFSVGEELEVSFNVESREYNGKWFHNLNAWKIDRVGQQVSNSGGGIPPYTADDIPPEPLDDQPGDLPF